MKPNLSGIVAAETFLEYSNKIRIALVAALLLTNAAAFAGSNNESNDLICPRYGECVPASAFDCQTVERSSLVTRVCYNSATRYMIVRLKRIDYHYCEIGAGVVAEFLAAESMGRFYNKRIKADSNDGLYDCRLHPVPTF